MSLNRGSLDKAIQDLKVKTLRLENLIVANRTITFQDKNYTVPDKAVMEAYLRIGSANKKYLPSILFAHGGNDGVFEMSMLDGSLIMNVLTGGGSGFFIFDKETTLGTKKLYIDGMSIAIGDADASNRITSIALRGYTANAFSPINIWTEELNSVQEYTQTFTAVDCSSYQYIILLISMTCGTANYLQFSLPQCRSYYGD